MTLTIAVIGGTGPQGKGLGYRFAKGGHDVIVGSRSVERAAEVAAEITGRGVVGNVAADTNSVAVTRADVILLAVPYEGHDLLIKSLAEDLAGKVIISCVNPLGFDEEGPFGLTVERSAAEAAAAIVPTARVTGAFHHVAAASLWGDDDFLHHEDILVCGDDPGAVALVAELAATVSGHAGVNVGALRLSRQLEPLTAVLISVNKIHNTRAGVALSGVPR